MTTSTVADAAPVTHHRTAQIEGVNIFYREAGPADAPVVLLLHGFPTSSHMFRNLIPALADRYHVIAPDYPGFGQSDMPDRSTFAYTFDRFAELVDGLLDRLGVTRYAMYVMDYGAPVGWRLALRHPLAVTGLIVQNGNAYDEGLKEFWDPIKAYWADGADAHRQALKGLFTLEITKFQYTDGVADVSRISPDNWVHDQSLLDRPGNNDIQLDIFYDYGTNLALYPRVQAWFREQPAADPDRLGQERQDLPGGRCPSLPARPARCRVSPARHRPLRARGQGGRDGALDPRFPRAQGRRELTGAARVSSCPGSALPLEAEMSEQRPPLPPFTAETAAQKVRMAEDAWNTRDPARVALAYTEGSRWRNRAEFLDGRQAIEAFLVRKWNRELDYRLIKELWTFRDNRIAVRFAYEWHDDSGHWFRSYGNENWEFDEHGLMRLRIASINDLPIRESERKYHWPLGRRPDDHPSLSDLGL